MIGFICVGMIGAIFFGELWMKNHVERKWKLGVTREKWKGRILLRRYHNRGAMLNAGENRRKLVAAVSVLMTAGTCVVFLLSLGQRGNHLLRVGLALLLGGGFSNTYDRLKRKYVVDYISFGVKWKWFRNIVFNAADFCIIIGALATALGAGG